MLGPWRNWIRGPSALQPQGTLGTGTLGVPISPAQMQSRQLNHSTPHARGCHKHGLPMMGGDSWVPTLPAGRGDSGVPLSAATSSGTCFIIPPNRQGNRLVRLLSAENAEAASPPRQMLGRTGHPTPPRIHSFETQFCGFCNSEGNELGL